MTARHSLVPEITPLEAHPYMERYAEDLERARVSYELTPTIYFFEAMDYQNKASRLQDMNLGIDRRATVHDDLMDQVHIYDTVNRRYAGFSNVLESLWYGPNAPKAKKNAEMGWNTVSYRDKFSRGAMAYLMLIHRITGSGASFDWDHGWRNTIVPHLAENADSMTQISQLIELWDGAMFTSIGNQIPPFNKPRRLTSGGREYLIDLAPELVIRTFHWLHDQKAPAGIQETVDKVLDFQEELGCKCFKFVLTAWVMDLAEYFPNLVDASSDCYHGKNAVEAIELIFDSSKRPKGMNKQRFYDRATRFFADTFNSHPMDIEDSGCGCDFIRWVENYIQPRGYKHVDRQTVFNSSFIKHPHGRQPWMTSK